MSETAPVMCSECGWTGYRGELVEDESTHACPSCGATLAVEE